VMRTCLKRYERSGSSTIEPSRMILDYDSRLQHRNALLFCSQLRLNLGRRQNYSPGTAQSELSGLSVRRILRQRRPHVKKAWLKSLRRP
jgi:hypothetical protein